MSTSAELFHFDDTRPSFEDLGKPNGATHWSEEILRNALGYESESSFTKAVMRAKQACLALSIPCEDHFTRQHDGSHLITRFGCYLVAMNADSKKTEVASAQAWFATLAETFQSHLQHADGIDRLLIREEVTDGQKTLASTAKRHGAENYAFFQNKGYMGMYNMSLDRLTRFKGVPKGEKLIDRMSKTELAAHLFRITQTAAKIDNDNIVGQTRLEQAALDVGKKVRNAVIDISGVRPENLPISENINSVKKKIKGTSKKLKSIDDKRKKSGDSKE